MELFDRELTVQQVHIAVFVPFGAAKRVHTNRPSHGFAYNCGCTVIYRFDGGRELVCHPGQCIYLPKGSNYTVDALEETTGPTPGTYAINFSLVDCTGSFDPFVIHVRGRDRALSLFERAELAWRRKGTGCREECFCSVYRLIQLLGRERADYSCLSKAMSRLAPALAYIEANYTTESISMDHLAALCSISQPHMRKLFQAAFSVSPAIYIRNLRLNYAKELLHAGEYSVTTVAALAGFNSVVYFDREFKKATGLSPRAYLARQQDG